MWRDDHEGRSFPFPIQNGHASSGRAECIVCGAATERCASAARPTMARASPTLTHKQDTASVCGQGDQSTDTAAGADHHKLATICLPVKCSLKFKYVCSMARAGSHEYRITSLASTTSVTNSPTASFATSMPSARLLLPKRFHLCLGFDATILPFCRVDLPGEHYAQILHHLRIQQGLLWVHALAARGKKRMGKRAGI